ncbi:hypothetical protein [Bradyrhizobium sp. Tv2a-2]|uniref:hypothetical protein n=1 Tax=Bradyrhizobium sp. Tv2a-2 TaxID=113395 RepID=UPI000464DF0F|nr:hypothetical protein [Bradyrhizobium sp. Tv2a-2]
MQRQLRWGSVMNEVHRLCPAGSDGQAGSARKVVFMKSEVVRWSLKGLSAILMWLWLQPCAAREEVKLTQSITLLRDSPSGVRMIMKTWVNESDSRSRFVIDLFSKAKSVQPQASYYERVSNFSAGKQVELSIWDAPDCAISQTMVFRVKSKSGDRLVVGTADRAPPKGDLVPQDQPIPQRIRVFVPKTNPDEDEPGKSSVWFDAVVEGVSDQSLCSQDEVRHAIDAFVGQHIVEPDVR